MKHVFLAVGIMIGAACTGTSKKKEAPHEANKIDSVTTCIKVVVNINTNEYKDVTARRYIKDSVREETIRTTASGQIIREMRPYRDTIYFAWWGFPIADSTGKTPRKNHLGEDSVRYQFVAVQKEWVIVDYNKNFK